MAVGELARIIFSTTVTILLSELVRSSGREAAKAKQPELEETQPTTPIQGNIIMSQYDLIGDDFGGVGADLIGEDALLHALSVSGYDDDEDVDLIEGLVGGQGNTEIVGKGAPKKAVRNALRKIAMRNAGAVVENALTRRRRYPLGFVPTVIDGGTSALIPSAPQNLFRPERLVIPSDIAFDLGVVDIKVGNQSQLVQSVEVPAALFSEVAIDTNVTFDTAEVGNQVSVQARNKIAAPIEFTAGLIGTIAK